LVSKTGIVAMESTMRLHYCEFMIFELMFCIHGSQRFSRFFAARRYDAGKAHEHFKEGIQVRKENELAELYRTIDLGLYEETRLLVCILFRN